MFKTHKSLDRIAFDVPYTPPVCPPWNFTNLKPTEEGKGFFMKDTSFDSKGKQRNTSLGNA